MKSIFSVLVVILILFSTSNLHSQGSIDSPNSFAIKILKEIYISDRNIFVSPISIYESLGLLETGAKGETKLELSTVLNLTGISELDLKNYENTNNIISDLTSVSLGNSIWLNNTIDLDSTFNSTVRKIFNCELVKLDFGNSTQVVNRVNNWVSSKTDGKIDKLFSEKEIMGSSLIMANAVYFKGNWLSEFSPSETYQNTFSDEFGDKSNVTFMRRSGDYRIFNYENVKGIELPYKDNDIIMLAILPERGKFISDLLIELNFDIIKRMIEDKDKPQNIDLEIPKFKIEYESDLIPLLRKMGVKRAFSESADFTGIGKVSDQITTMKHKSYLEIDEKGTVAAASTGVVMARSMNLFRLNRPFLFFIIDKKSGLILFEGVMNVPSN